MNQKGRTPKEKVWDQRFHHNFYSSYNIDPDVHVFLFTHSVDTTTLFRKALREYMAAHKDKAENPQYQREVFHAASSQVANGQRPVGSEIVALLAGEHYEKKEIAPKKTKPKAVSLKSPAPAPTDFSEQVKELQTPIELTPPQLVVQDNRVYPKKKPAVVLDFGPVIDLESSASNESSNNKTSQREKWLARNKF